MLTPISKKPSVILEVLKTRPGYREPPRMMGNPNLRDSSKWCAFHRDHGHQTDACYQLRELIEKLIQSGDLAEFVTKKDAPRTADNTGGHRGVINTISGGSISGRESKNAQKNYARAVYNLYSQPSKKFKSDSTISFSDEDYEGVLAPHHDALVVTASIDDYLVNKVLIDNGSSVNILYHHALSQMDLRGIQMDKCSESPLYGFGNNPVQIEGVITLRVGLGQQPRRIQSETKFYVVKVASSYNAILGRPMLTAIMAVTSIPHLKMKFPTPDGVGVVSGDL